MTPYRSPHHDTLSFNRHSEWRQECFVRKQEKRQHDMEWRIYYSDDISHGFFRTPLSYSLQIYACKKDSHLCKSFPFISSFLSRLCVAVSLSFARPFAPSKDVLQLSRVTRTDRKPRHMKKDTYICKCLFLYQQLPILPGRFRPSTFGVCELNFRVRHGYGWSSQLSPLFLWETILSKPYRRSPEVIRLSRCF